MGGTQGAHSLDGRGAYWFLSLIYTDAYVGRPYVIPTGEGRGGVPKDVLRWSCEQNGIVGGGDDPGTLYILKKKT